MSADETRIRLYRDRVAILGMTQSGKSSLARYLFELARCRRVLVDPKHSWSVAGVRPAHRLEEIDWSAPLIHVRPPWLDRRFSDELYFGIFRRLRHALVWTDEAYGVCTSAWGAGVDALQTQGAELEIGHVACSQRPVNARRTLWTESEHLFLFGELDARDVDVALEGFAFVDRGEVLTDRKSVV